MGQRSAHTSKAKISSFFLKLFLSSDETLKPCAQPSQCSNVMYVRALRKLQFDEVHWRQQSMAAEFAHSLAATCTRTVNF